MQIATFFTILTLPYFYFLGTTILCFFFFKFLVQSIVFSQHLCLESNGKLIYYVSSVMVFMAGIDVIRSAVYRRLIQILCC